MFYLPKQLMLTLFISVGVFFAPVVPLLIVVGTFILLDTISGVIAAFKNKEKITSRKLSQVAIKMLIYQLVVISVYFLDVFILGGFAASFFAQDLIIVKLVSFVLISIEAKSINENIEKTLGINIIQYFRQLLKDVRNDINAVKDLEDIANDNKKKK